MRLSVVSNLSHGESVGINEIQIHKMSPSLLFQMKFMCAMGARDGA